MRLSFRHVALEGSVVLVPLALLLVAASAGLIWSNLAGRHVATSAPRAAAPAIPVLVSAADIPRGRILAARDLSLRLYGPDRAPEDILHRTQEAEGRMALVALRAGDPIRAAQLSAQAAAGLAARVPDGYRAYALAVSEAAIAGGFLQPGDRVDLYVTLPGALIAQPGAAHGDRSRSTPLLQAARVLAVGGRMEASGAASPGASAAVRTVTLALPAADLAKVALASRLGTVTFAIRNPVDDETRVPPAASLASLLGETRKTARAGAGVPMLLGRDRLIAATP